MKTLRAMLLAAWIVVAAFWMSFGAVQKVREAVKVSYRKLGKGNPWT